MMAVSKTRKNSSRLIVTVSLPKDLVEVMSAGRFFNRSAVITEAIERYLQVREPTLYDMLLAHRREEKYHG